jgi:hypothetical protein
MSFKLFLCSLHLVQRSTVSCLGVQSGREGVGEVGIAKPLKAERGRIFVIYIGGYGGRTIGATRDITQRQWRWAVEVHVVNRWSSDVSRNWWVPSGEESNL